MGSGLTIRVPGDYVLGRDVCSYGYFLLAPNHWEPSEGSFRTTLGLGVQHRDAVTVWVTQAGGKGGPLRVACDRMLTGGERTQARAMLWRMLNLGVGSDVVRAFHRVDPRWKRSGRARLMRSATLFEDVIKTVTSCNVAWPSTINMNQRLCEELGSKSAAGLFSFPSAAKLSRVRAGTLRGRCRVGYRDQRMIDLARLFVRGEVDEAWLTDPANGDDEVFGFLVGLPGIGPYAAGNIMQLLGRYSRLALDTESVRHARSVLEMSGTDAEIMKRLAGHYEPFGAFRFLSYWFELWADYERKRGKATTWERETTGKTFTASKL